MAAPNETLILIHRIVGYTTTFIVVPAALWVFAKPIVHRKWGRAYFYLMLFLYLTGTWFTFTQHELHSWGFARNLTFNFFGFSLVLYGYRAIRLFRRSGAVTPTSFDRFLAILMTVSVIALFCVAAVKNTPMKIFTALGIWLCAIEWKEQRLSSWDKPLLFRRHIRYIVASYFYVLTVVSIVHLKDELPNNARWLWASIAGTIVVWLLTSAKEGRFAPKFLRGVSQGVLTRRVVSAILIVAMIFGGYVIYDLMYGSAVISQS